ncbi:MAG: hypothetical protein ACR2F6_04000 [Mycobacteriales bacterium]
MPMITSQNNIEGSVICTSEVYGPLTASGNSVTVQLGNGSVATCSPTWPAATARARNATNRTSEAALTQRAAAAKAEAAASGPARL